MRIIAALVIILALSCGAFAGGPPATYTKSCQSCHGADGNPSAAGAKMGAPAFSSADVQKMSEAELVGEITNGKNKMPAYKGKLTDDQIKAIVQHVRTLQ